MATVDEAVHEKVYESEGELAVDVDAVYVTDESRWQAVLTRDPAAEEGSSTRLRRPASTAVHAAPRSGPNATT